MKKYDVIKKQLLLQPKVWLVTGSAGFIGFNLVKRLLELNQYVVGLDNYLTSSPKNIEELLKQLPDSNINNFKFIEGDIRNFGTCRKCCEGVEIVLHQAALGSVTRSIDDPISTHQHNIDGFLNMLVAARDEGIKRFVYASSSSVYGDSIVLPMLEQETGLPLSPYAATKHFNETYAEIFNRIYGLSTIGLRYFNVFGPRQDPKGPYAAVIPRWFEGLLQGNPVYIYGDGKTSRDFCYIDNVLQANILAACTEEKNAMGQVYNIAFSQRTTLNELFFIIRKLVAEVKPEVAKVKPAYEDFRTGDVRHSLADITKAKHLLGYEPTYSVEEGLKETAAWYFSRRRE